MNWNLRLVHAISMEFLLLSNGRIFPNQTLHFVHSSYSLQWLSKVPEGIENNKGNIYMSNTSPLNVLKAYYEQFQRDFSLFLKCRAEELVEGGCMVLTFVGRRSENQSSKECCYIWELMAKALNDMVLQGIIKEENFDTFNIPSYNPSPSEVKLDVLKEGSFTINSLEVSEYYIIPYTCAIEYLGCTIADDLFPLFDMYGKVVDIFIPKDRRYILSKHNGFYHDSSTKTLPNVSISLSPLIR
ncbi:unnamed protein product [Lupinus luteus]|uniref:Uncharacterized protein n=1 Tax=Lupinus luteus TaxID=3873 RepID=A0AAV1YMV5_LUPLU